MSEAIAVMTDANQTDVYTTVEGLLLETTIYEYDYNTSVGNETEFYAEIVLAPPYAQAIIILLYSMVTFLAVGGNVIVCYIVIAYHRMRTVTNYFIVNLAISDILMAILCVPFSFVPNVVTLKWPFGTILCPVVGYVQGISVFLSAFTLVAISLDRYVAIIYPLRPRMRTKQAAIIIVSIWILSLSVPLPVAILSRVSYDRCFEEWEDDSKKYIYSLILMILQYFLPLFVLMFTYMQIGIAIWVKKPPGEAVNNRDQRLAASKRKMVKMMITVVIIYALCWLPFHTITLVGDTQPVIWKFKYIQVVWVTCHWLAMSSCCYNPMVYCWMNSRYRNGFRYVLRFCPCVNYSSDAQDTISHRSQTYISTLRTCGNQKSKKELAVQSPATPTSSVFENESVPLNRMSNGFGKDSLVAKRDDHSKRRYCSRGTEHRLLTSDSE